MADIGVGVVGELVTAAEFEPSSGSSMFKTLTCYPRRHCNIVVYLNAFYLGFYSNKCYMLHLIIYSCTPIYT